MADMMIKDLILPSLHWNTDLINVLFDGEWARKICAMPICVSTSNDYVFWKHTPSRIYSVKSGYAICLSTHLSRYSTPKDLNRINYPVKAFCKRKLWHLPGPQVWKILLWKIITDSLSVGAEFARRNIVMDQMCPLCCVPDSIETLDHLFRDCVLVKRLWACSSLGISTNFTDCICLRDWIINWILFFDSKENSSSSIILFLSMVWSIWRVRNEVIFSGKTFSVDYFYNLQACVAKAALEAEEFATSKASRLGQSSFNPLDTIRSDIRNHFPFFMVGEKGACKCFRAKVDASWVDFSRASLGWVVYSPEGVRYCTFARSFVAESAIQAEAMGIRDLITWALGHNILYLDISSDCLQLLLQLAGVELPHHLTKGLLQDIEHFFTFFHCLCFTFLPRHLNMVAHNLARAELGL
ncbi:uncharacterized protein LOC141589680 [Silene latifolia]|uniref:uncharacterized protein LOC141589680 n=1 Tax=Silene latifolia TaxID=37657 RepID=UPI003D77B362